ncbi:MAG TPA: phage tail protein [Firmicutes bacterium]|jgi:phage tail protein X|nr:phage tail protein [Bacillota bacterium]
MASTYNTKMGDTFDSIAFSLLGDEVYTKELMEANPGYLDVVIFSGGVTLVIPDIERSGTTSSNTPPWRSAS